MIVVDASAVLDAASSEDGFSLIGESELVAPPLMWSEALSVLHETVWRAHTSPRLGILVRNRLLSAPIACRAPEGLYAESWRIAEHLGWAKTYDAEYIALARLLDCRLLTLDERLRRGAAHLVTIVGPAEL
jgi:predicted nucleic acid-binding protein